MVWNKNLSLFLIHSGDDSAALEANMNNENKIYFLLWQFKFLAIPNRKIAKLIEAGGKQTFFNNKFNCKEEMTERAYAYRNVLKKQYDEL